MDYSTIIAENARLSEERANSLKGGQELLNYVNVFETKRLSVFRNIASKMWNGCSLNGNAHYYNLKVDVYV